MFLKCVIFFQYSFIVKCNTYPVETSKSSEQTTNIPIAGVKNFTFKQLGPNVKPTDTQQDNSRKLEFAYVNVNASKLPASVVSKIIHLETSYKEGELTMSGLKRKKSRLIAEVLQFSTNNHLVYHKENDWPPEVQVSENLGKNTSSVNSLSKLDQQENKTKNILKTAHNAPLNASKQLSSRALLWVENPQERYNETNSSKATPHKSTFKKRNPSIIHNIKARKKEDNGTLATYMGSLPWEKQRLFPIEDPQEGKKKSTLPLIARRHLLDMFAESLLHVNRLFNSEYGYQARRVPAHMPHFINKGVIESLHEK